MDNELGISLESHFRYISFCKTVDKMSAIQAQEMLKQVELLRIKEKETIRDMMQRGGQW